MADTNNSVQKKGIAKFFREAKSERKKVSWPDKNQLVHNTIVILVFILIATAILSVLDIGFAKAFQAVAGLTN